MTYSYSITRQTIAMQCSVYVIVIDYAATANKVRQYVLPLLPCGT